MSELVEMESEGGHAPGEPSRSGSDSCSPQSESHVVDMPRDTEETTSIQLPFVVRVLLEEVPLRLGTSFDQDPGGEESHADQEWRLREGLPVRARGCRAIDEEQRVERIGDETERADHHCCTNRHTFHGSHRDPVYMSDGCGSCHAHQDQAVGRQAQRVQGSVGKCRRARSQDCAPELADDGRSQTIAEDGVLHVDVCGAEAYDGRGAGGGGAVVAPLNSFLCIFGGHLLSLLFDAMNLVDLCRLSISPSLGQTVAFVAGDNQKLPLPRTEMKSARHIIIDSDDEPHPRAVASLIDLSSRELGRYILIVQQPRYQS